MKNNLLRNLWPRVRNFTEKSYLFTYLLAATSLSVMFYSCQNEGNLPIASAGEHFVSVNSTTGGPLIQKHLTWIAKGLAGIADQNSTVKAEIHTLIEATNFYAETNEKLESDLNLNIGFNYETEVNGWLQVNQPGNDYDPSFFFDIDIDNCPGKVSVRIPEADLIDQTKLHVVTAENVLNPSPASYGYYLSSGSLDSLIITIDNMDSVYLWVVGVDNNCDDTAICGNGVLDYGENCESCPEDCPTSLHVTDPSSDTYKLIFKEVKLWTDNTRGPGGHPNDHYQESHLQGKYKIQLGFATFNNNGSGTINHARIDETLFGITANKSCKIGKYKAWGKNAEIRRKDIDKNKVNRGSHTIDVVDIELVDDFQPNRENIVFTLFEKDKNSVQWNRNEPSIWSNGWSYTYSPGQNANVPPSGKPAGGTFPEDSWKIIECTGTQTEPGPPFVHTGSDTWEYVLPLDGEADVVFKLIKN